MAITVSYSTSISGGGVTLQPQPVRRSGSSAIGLIETLDAAQAGSLTTRSTDTTGTITMSSADHTIATANVVDIYWTGGVRYGVTVGTVTTTSVPISAGSGDNLPTAATAVTVVVTKVANIAIDGDEADLLAIMLETNDKALRTAGHIQLRDSANAEIAEIDLVANIPQVWDLAGGSANPFTGNPITTARISQAGTSATQNYQLKIVGVQDASP